jgi:hypothetical protein
MQIDSVKRFSSIDLVSSEVTFMGKYFPGWIMGVPVIVLVIIYLLFNQAFFANHRKITWKPQFAATPH